LSILEEAYLAGVDMKHFYAMLLKHFRNLLLVKIAADGSSSFDIAPEQVEKLKIQTNNTTRETLQRYLEILLDEADNLRRSQEVRMKIEPFWFGWPILRRFCPWEKFWQPWSRWNRRSGRVHRLCRAERTRDRLRQNSHLNTRRRAAPRTMPVPPAKGCGDGGAPACRKIRAGG